MSASAYPDGLSEGQIEPQSPLYEGSHLISECCGVPAGEFEDIGICPKCREYAEWVDESEEVE